MPIVRIARQLVYFAHVPRAAGTAVEQYLQARFGPLAFHDPAHLSREGGRWSNSSPQHLPAWALDRLFPAGFFDASFAVVRHPCERLKSVFLRQRDIEGTLDPETDFTDWLASLPRPGFEFDNHTRPMRDFIPDGTRIFRIEDGLAPLVDWLDDLAGNRNGPRGIAVANSHAQRSAAAGVPPRAEPVLDPQTRSLIAERYPNDFAWFGYQPQKTPEADAQPATPPAPPQPAAPPAAAHPVPPPIPSTPVPPASRTAPGTAPETGPRAEPKATRTVVLHHHLFKNAGTSLDQILKHNFGDRWVTREFSLAGRDNTAAVEAWIRDTPKAAVFSTHTALGPLPRVDGVRIVSMMLLRDPIARIRSAYRFERLQQADTWGAQLAKEHDFEGYVRARLARPGDRQCRNFQTHRLASMVPGEGSELERARAAAGRITVLGNVAAFDDAVTRLAAEIGDLCPDFSWTATRANVSNNPGAGDDDTSAELEALLREANHDDLVLLDQLAAAGENRS